MNSGVLHVIPLLLVLGLIYVLYTRTGERRPTYSLSEPWTHEPILWAATDEVVPGGGPGAHHGHENVVNVGGGASGRW